MFINKKKLQTMEKHWKNKAGYDILERCLRSF